VDDWQVSASDIEALKTVMASIGAFPLVPTAEVYGRPSEELFNSTEDLGVVVYDHFQRKQPLVVYFQ